MTPELAWIFVMYSSGFFILSLSIYLLVWTVHLPYELRTDRLWKTSGNDASELDEAPK